MSFYTAARDGQIELLKHHLQHGADVHQRFNNDRTALHFACDGGSVEVVKILLASQADVNQPDTFNKDTPLHLASEAGHTEVVRILLKNRGHVNAQDQMNGETPLHLACEAGFSDIVQLLLDYGADASIENVYKKRALHYADATTQEALERSDDAVGGQQDGALSQGQPQVDTMSVIQKQILESVVDGDLVGLGDEEDVEDDDLVQALEETGPSRALQTQEGNTWYAAHSIAGRASDGRDKQNQDAFLVMPNLGGDAEISLFGVFDGHGRNGHLVSYFAKSVLPGILTREIVGIREAAIEVQARAENGAPSKAAVCTGGMATILSDACATLQKMLEEQDKFDCQSSGSTAIFSVVAYGTVYMANVGDSRALLAHVTQQANTDVNDREKLVVVAMSVDQVPNVREERERVEQSGGVVRRDEDSLTGEQGPFRVWRRDLAGPGLAMSRSIGDVAAHQIGVSALPVVMQYRLSEADRLLIIATDGVWDMLDNSEVVDISARASGDCKGDPRYASAQVCETARRAWEFKETRVDDITCLLIFLPPQPTPPPTAGADRTAAEPAPSSAHTHAFQHHPQPVETQHGVDMTNAHFANYTSIEPNQRPAQPSGNYGVNMHGNSVEQQAYGNPAAVSSSSYIALDRNSYRGLVLAIPYRPAEQAQSHYNPSVYGSEAYRPYVAEGNSVGAPQTPPEYGDGYYRPPAPSAQDPYYSSHRSSLPPQHAGGPPRPGSRAQVLPLRQQQARAPGQQDDGFFGMGNLVGDNSRGQGQEGGKEGDGDCSIQ